MTSKPLSYTSYRDPMTTGSPLRTGSSDRVESARDLESCWRPLSEIHQSAMHGWGVAEGFVIRLVPTSTGGVELRVGTGVAVDAAGRTISLGRGQPVPNTNFFSGAAELGLQANQPNALPMLGNVYQYVDSTNPASSYDYVVMTTAAAAGTRVLAVQYWEWFNQNYLGDHLYFYDQTPWLRLLDPSQVVEGVTIPLAEVVLSTTGAVQSIAPGLRRSCTLPARSVQLVKARLASGAPNSVVNDVAFARLDPRAGGGLDLVIPSAPPDADDQLALQVTVAGAQALAVKKSGLAIGGDTAINGKHAFRGNDTWLRLNQDGAFPSGVHTPGNFAPNALNVGGVNGWGNPGPGNAWIAGSLSIGTTLAIGGDVAIGGKHAFRGNDPWLRLNQDGAFPSGVHTPGNFAPNALNVGGVNGWGNPGPGNAWVSGTLTVWGSIENTNSGALLGQISIGGARHGAVPYPYETIQLNPGHNLRIYFGSSERLLVTNGGDVAINGKHAFRGNDPWLRLNQDGAFPSGVHTPGNFAPNALNVGGVNSWGNPGAGNAWVAGTLTVWGSIENTNSGALLGQISIGGARHGAIPYPYETIQLNPGHNLRIWFGSTERLIVQNNGDATLQGGFLTVAGRGGEMTVLGGDGVGGDVQIGSSKSGVSTVSAWNFATGWMDVAGRNWLGHSDARSKERIEPFTGGLEKVLKLRPVTFQWKNDEKKTDQLGLVAQEVKEILPLVVQESSRGSLAIAYNSLTALLIQAVKEQQGQIDQLQKTVAELRKR